MTTKRLEERFAYSGGKVDRSGPRPIIRDVLLCGPTSANRRRYLREAFAGDRVKKYNGRPVFLNHGTGGAPRQYESRIAKVINARHRADGMPVGDLEVRPKHPYAEAFLDDAENDPTSVGMSHVAHCQTRLGKDGWDDVHAVSHVESVDVVLDPATTKGLHEQTGSRPVKISLKQFVARFGAKWGAHKWAAATMLVEEMGDMGAAPVMDEPPADVADGDLKSALTSALMPMVEEAFETGDATKAMAALKDFIKLHAKHTGKAEPKGSGSEGGGGSGSEEGRKPLDGAITEAFAVCESIGFKPDLADLNIIAASSADRRKAVAERLKKASEGTAAPEKPNSAGRHRIDPAAGAGDNKPVTEGKPPVDAKAFAEFIR